MKTLLSLFLLIPFTAYTQGVKNERCILNETVKNRSHEITLKDSLTKKFINEYISKYELEANKIMMIVTIKEEIGKKWNTSKKIWYITCSSTGFDSTRFGRYLPSFYTVLDQKILVLIYTGIEYDFICPHYDFTNELQEIAKSMGLQLIDDDLVLEEPPIIQYIEENGEITRKEGDELKW